MMSDGFGQKNTSSTIRQTQFSTQLGLCRAQIYIALKTASLFTAPWQQIFDYSIWTGVTSTSFPGPRRLTSKK